MKRTRPNFSKKGPKTVASLAFQNRKLRELLDSNDNFESIKARRKNTTWGIIFEAYVDMLVASIRLP